MIAAVAVVVVVVVVSFVVGIPVVYIELQSRLWYSVYARHKFSVSPLDFCPSTA